MVVFYVINFQYGMWNSNTRIYQVPRQHAFYMAFYNVEKHIEQYMCYTHAFFSRSTKQKLVFYEFFSFFIFCQTTQCSLITFYALFDYG